MKKTLLILGFSGLLLIGCGSIDTDNVFNVSNDRPNNALVGDGFTGNKRCVVSYKETWDEIIAPQDTALFYNLIGDTLRTYIVHLEDGMDYFPDKEVYDTLEHGNLYPDCRIEE
jgi:hypothetical protein